MPDLNEYQGLREDLMPEYFHRMVNIEQNPEFLPYAKRLADDFFRAAAFSADPAYAPFDYSPSALDERLKSIYDAFVEDIDSIHWLDTGLMPYPVTVGRDYTDDPIIRRKIFNTGRFSNKVVKERLRQGAPFNLVDGAWLQRIQQAGPSDRVHANLFQIWDDEAGNGRVEQNHSNVYDALMRSMGFYLPPITTREFLDRDFLPAAFTGAVFQLCVGLFPEEFFPELLGMTLYLEWEATPTLTPAVRRLRGRNIDPHFYSLHVAIDNITAGHGFLANESIKLFLAAAETDTGQAGVQVLWQRIWRGYVTWATLSGFGLSIVDLSLALDLKQIDLSYPLEVTNAVLTDLSGLHARLNGVSPDPPSRFVMDRLRPSTRTIITGVLDDTSRQAITQALLAELNLLIQDERAFYTEERFNDVALGEDTRALLATDPGGEHLVRLNRLLLRDAFVGQIGDVPTDVPPQPHPDYRAYFRGRMERLVQRKANAAAPLHKGRFVDGVDLGSLFSNPSELVQRLERSPLIDVQHPRDSRLLELTQFNGPMYKIFTEDEKDVILDWIESLQPPAAPQQPMPIDPAKAAIAMRQLIERLADRAKAEISHSGIVFPDETGTDIELLDWFDNPRGLMAAFRRRSGWVVPGNAGESRLFQQFTGPMSFLGVDVITVVREWLDSGAELPPPAEVPPVHFMALPSTPLLALEVIRTPPTTLQADRREFAKKREFIGMGAVH